ncbi:preprotein translocase subunit SecG [Neisseria animalis]|uniref:Protein-export membrane protein SecG n=1 Tax=Neisseria animalis TaxID=492 RepID=A0A5P3MR91_NEIAN|nr:preprotein translocase subunit SecG [Neisseria animalis]QEY24117.1 preprotein translocase subunit SecG [Neisseria animalis]ROW32685.1 preprotein translocase subunit SecG [Neisseria animalis]VEE06320.1 protein-export integral membrane protein [Neisseria animalis]
MEAFKTIIWIFNIMSALAVIVLVLLQHGKGADAGATFGSGSGSAQGVFGSGGNANFLSRSTAIAATVFFATCMAMVYIHSNTTRHGLDFSNVQQSKPANTQSAPASTQPAAPVQQ